MQYFEGELYTSNMHKIPFFAICKSENHFKLQIALFQFWNLLLCTFSAHCIEVVSIYVLFIYFGDFSVAFIEWCRTSYVIHSSESYNFQTNLKRKNLFWVHCYEKAILNFGNHIQISNLQSGNFAKPNLNYSESN